MNHETRRVILNLLQEETDTAKSMMIRIIESGSDSGVEERISNYRKVYNALCDFEDWLEDDEE